MHVPGSLLTKCLVGLLYMERALMTVEITVRTYYARVIARWLALRWLPFFGCLSVCRYVRAVLVFYNVDFIFGG